MNIKQNNSYGVESYNIERVNLNEMRQMVELKNRINDVLDSHTKDSEEKKYVDDNDLRLMRAILSVFTRDYSNNTESEFDKFLKAEQKKKKEKPVEQPQQQEEKIEDEPIIDPYKD